MNRTGMFCVLALAACGGAQRSTHPHATSGGGSSDESMANPSLPPVAERPSATRPVRAPIEPAAPAQLEAAMPAPPKQALAMLTAVKNGEDVGTVSFELGSDNVIVILGDFHDLPPGKHAFYIYEHGDCSNKARKIGKHLDPTKQQHGPPASSARHAGDFGDIVIAKDGTGTFQMNTDSLSFEPGRADTLTGRALVVHAKADNTRGNAGAPIACGVISMRDSMLTE